MGLPAEASLPAIGQGAVGIECRVNDPAIENLIAPLVAALQDGKLPDEAMDIIAGSYPELDDSELVTLLEQALFVADVWGRLNADA